MARRPVTVTDILDGHVVLDLDRFDRIYLNGWVPTLQVPGQVVSFLTGHLGFPIPSPAILERIGLRFRKAVSEFARDDPISPDPNPVSGEGGHYQRDKNQEDSSGPNQPEPASARSGSGRQHDSILPVVLEARLLEAHPPTPIEAFVPGW